MTIWDSFWGENKGKNIFYKIGNFLPAGPWDFYWRWKRYEYFLDSIETKNPKILEIGCGTGVMTFKMVKKLGGSAVLLDKSEQALDVAKNHSKDFDLDGLVEYITDDVFSFKNNKFDIVHSQGLIEHFHDQSKIIKEHFRLAKKNGYVIILAPRPSFWYRKAKSMIEYYKKKWIFGYENPKSTEEVIQMIKENGGKIIKKRNFIFSMGCLSKKITD